MEQLTKQLSRFKTNANFIKLVSSVMVLDVQLNVSAFASALRGWLRRRVFEKVRTSNRPARRHADAGELDREPG